MKKSTSNTKAKRVSGTLPSALPVMASGEKPDPMDQAWIDLFDRNQDGTPDHPYGDLYRMWLINPTVIQMCLAAARRKAGEEDLTSIDLGLAVQGQYFSEDIGKRLRLEKLEMWHAGLLKEIGNWRPLKNLNILDLGCGLGYLAPFLTGLGANYYGMDRSEALIKKAMSWWSSSSHEHVSFQKFDLATLPADPVKAAANLFARCSNQVPDVVLAINVLEYLQKPEMLLAALRHLLAPKYATASAFFVTPNPDYYLQLSPREGSQRLVPTEPSDIMVACLNRAVPKEQCRLLGRFKVSEFLRDSGFVTLQEAFLTIHPGGDRELKEHYEDGCKAVNLGLAPFVSFAATPLPLGRPATDTQWKTIDSHSVLKYLRNPNSPSYDKELITKIRAEGSVISLRKGDRLLARHNLGGRLYIVIKGQFCANEAPENVFKSPDLFGELEANYCIEAGAARYGCYVNDVVAMEDGSEVFVIPTHLASKLVGSGSSLRAELFAKLREKVILRNARLTLRAAREAPLYNASLGWLEFARVNERGNLSEATSDFFFPKILENPFSHSKNFGKYELGRVAGALLELQEIEHRMFRRCPWAHSVLVDTDTLSRIADLIDDDIKMYVRALHWLGAIDAFAPAGKVCGPEVIAVVEEHFKVRTTGDPNWEKETKEAIGRWARQASSHNFWSGKQPPEEQMTGKFQTVFDQFYRQRNDGNSFSDLLHRALIALARVNCLLFNETPNFFVVRDLPLLRSLVYDPEPVLNRHLFTRAFSVCPANRHNSNPLPPLKQLEEKSRDAGAIGRLKFYSAVLCQFVVTDLDQNMGTLCYSTGVATDRVPDVSYAAGGTLTRKITLPPSMSNQIAL